MSSPSITPAPETPRIPSDDGADIPQHFSRLPPEMIALIFDQMPSIDQFALVKTKRNWTYIPSLALQALSECTHPKTITCSIYFYSPIRLFFAEDRLPYALTRQRSLMTYDKETGCYDEVSEQGSARSATTFISLQSNKQVYSGAMIRRTSNLFRWRSRSTSGSLANP